MKRAQVACLFLVLMQVGAAQAAAGTRDVRDLSARWAEYYATIYRVPVDLVEAIIDEESGWDPFAVSSKGAVGLMPSRNSRHMRFVSNSRQNSPLLRIGPRFLEPLSGAKDVIRELPQRTAGLVRICG